MYRYSRSTNINSHLYIDKKALTETTVRVLTNKTNKTNKTHEKSHEFFVVIISINYILYDSTVDILR